MEAKRRRSDEDPLAASDGWISQRLEPRRRSGLNIASSDPTLDGLEEDTTFPNLSKGRLQSLNYLFFSLCSPSPPSLRKEYEIGSHFNAEASIYSQSHADVQIEVGTQLDVLDLLGDHLLSFNSTSTQNVPSLKPTKFRRYAGTSTSEWGKDSPKAQRIQPLKLESGINLGRSPNLKGKYVMICCVFVPSIWSSRDFRMVYHTALASHELARRDDFVLVVVPMMRKGFTHDYSAYQHFLSGFSCLAVPLHETRRREYICSTLGFRGYPTLLILDPSQTVLYHGWPQVLSLVGGAEHACFPFTMDSLHAFERGDCVLENRSLNDLLGLSDTDVLYNIEYHAGNGLKEDRCITISELKQKFVGIYYCFNGISLSTLEEVYEECKRKEYELEIVVVGCPFVWQVPPKLQDGFIIEAFAREKQLRGWWFFPFDNTVCHRLWRLSKMHLEGEDLVIVNPIKKYVDPYGFSIIEDFGMDGYPFTRWGLIEKELKRKMGLRLDSLLLPWTHVCRKLDSGSIIEVPVEEVLKNKIVLLCLYEHPRSTLAEELGAWYKKNIKGKVSDVEVVAVSIDGRTSGTRDKDFMDVGWLVCPTDPSKSDKVCKELFHPRCGENEAVVAFGEDGRIQSMDASHILKCQGPPFHGDLHEEIRKEFHNANFFYMQKIESV